MRWLRDYSDLALVGRPVLMVGTAFNAAKNAESDMAANALTPARINSLFLTELANLPARCLRSSSTVYSALGMVKLSRTSFGFFPLLVFSTLEGVTALIACLAGVLTTALLTVLTAAFTGVLAAAFATVLAGVLTAGLMAVLAGARATVVDFFAARFAMATLGAVATGAMDAGKTGDAVLAGAGSVATVFAFATSAVAVLLLVATMAETPLNKRNIQFISFIEKQSSG
ncbi:MAG: hypothetical protein V4713_16470 [Pseudomonadota bacterium]